MGNGKCWQHGGGFGSTTPERCTECRLVPEEILDHQPLVNNDEKAAALGVIDTDTGPQVSLETLHDVVNKSREKVDRLEEFVVEARALMVGACLGDKDARSLMQTWLNKTRIAKAAIGGEGKS